VENALKYGVLKDPDNPLSIRLKISEEKIWFQVTNKILQNPEVVSNGIGLNNIEKRLHRTYGNGFTCTLNRDHSFYSTILTIPKQL
jgi:two-component system, LytTR family, sensor kinase